jgi:FkbM family methyltransferase
MNLKAFIGKLIPKLIKLRLNGFYSKYKISSIIAEFLPEMICVDIGASYYPHHNWLIFLNSEKVRWLAVDPIKENLTYTNQWNWPSKIYTCTSGLSRNGGVQKLFVTNVDSGSSLLPPDINKSMKHRILDKGYYFPVTKKNVKTLTLKQVLKSVLIKDAPIFIKLDTQGTELSILQGSEDFFGKYSIVGIETETTMLAQPIYKGSGKFWQMCRYLEKKGFELLDVKLNYANHNSVRFNRKRNSYLNECDAIFALRRDIAARLSVNHRIGLLAFYVTNFLYHEALSLLNDDEVMREVLRKKGCKTDELSSLLFKYATK